MKKLILVALMLLALSAPFLSVPSFATIHKQVDLTIFAGSAKNIAQATLVSFSVTSHYDRIARFDFNIVTQYGCCAIPNAGQEATIAPGQTIRLTARLFIGKFHPLPPGTYTFEVYSWNVSKLLSNLYSFQAKI